MLSLSEAIAYCESRSIELRDLHTEESQKLFWVARYLEALRQTVGDPLASMKAERIAREGRSHDQG